MLQFLSCLHSHPLWTQLRSFSTAPQHDPTFSPTAFKFDPRHYRKSSPIVHVEEAIVVPPHAQNDVGMLRLRDLLADSDELRHLPFSRDSVVMVNRNEMYEHHVSVSAASQHDYTPHIPTRLSLTVWAYPRWLSTGAPSD